MIKRFFSAGYSGDCITNMSSPWFMGIWSCPHPSSFLSSLGFIAIDKSSINEIHCFIITFNTFLPPTLPLFFLKYKYNIPPAHPCHEWASSPSFLGVSPPPPAHRDKKNFFLQLRTQIDPKQSDDDTAVRWLLREDLLVRRERKAMVGWTLVMAERVIMSVKASYYHRCIRKRFRFDGNSGWLGDLYPLMRDRGEARAGNSARSFSSFWSR